MKTTLMNRVRLQALLLGSALLAVLPVAANAAPDATTTTTTTTTTAPMPDPGLTQHARLNGTGFYISVGLGGSYDPSANVSIPNSVQGTTGGNTGTATIPVKSKSSLEGGFSEFKLGYDWSVTSVDPNWIVGTELELDGGGSFFDGKISSPTTINGKTVDNPLNGKTLYDGVADGLGFISARTGYNLGPVRPYIGAGIGGGVFATYSGSIKDNGSNKNSKIGAAETVVPAYRGFAGLNYFIDPQWTLNLEYSYQATTEDVVVAKGQPGENNVGTIRQHQLLFGFSYYP